MQRQSASDLFGSDYPVVLIQRTARMLGLDIEFDPATGKLMLSGALDALAVRH